MGCGMWTGQPHLPQVDFGRQWAFLEPQESHNPLVVLVSLSRQLSSLCSLTASETKESGREGTSSWCFMLHFKRKSNEVFIDLDSFPGDRFYSGQCIIRQWRKRHLRERKKKKSPT